MQPPYPSVCEFFFLGAVEWFLCVRLVVVRRCIEVMCIFVPAVSCACLTGPLLCARCGGVLLWSTV